MIDTIKIYTMIKNERERRSISTPPNINYKDFKGLIFVNLWNYIFYTKIILICKALK